MMLSNISPLILGANVFTSAHLANEPSMPSMNKAIAKYKKTNEIFFSTAASIAKKLT